MKHGAQGDTATSDISGATDAPHHNPEQIRAALRAVLDSPEFDGASRVKAFLEYVVEEYLAGRGDEIRSKTIAEDVYGRSLADGDDPLAIVRVDAGRLRRRLTAYYNGSGSADPMSIHIDPGGYCPRFEVAAPPEDSAPTSPDPAPAPPRKRSRLGLAAAFVAVFVAGGVLAAVITGLTQQDVPAVVETPKAPSTEEELREVLFRLSPAKLQASNLAQDARELMFPALDRSRLTSALSLFDHAILLDPDYYGGHAGAAQIRAILAMITMDQTERGTLLSAAQASAQRAVALAPDKGWSHSAYALAAYVARDCETAWARSEHARRLAPSDVHVQNFYALVALFCGRVDVALETAQEWVNAPQSSHRLGFANVIVASHFYLGNYEDAVDAAFGTIRSGGPVSPLNVAFLTASYTALGAREAAEESRALLTRAWPNYPIGAVVQSLFVDPALQAKLLTTLAEAGLASEPAR